MSNTNGLDISGSIFNNITLVANLDNTDNGSIEIAGSVFTGSIKEYNTNEGILIENFVKITSTENVLNSSATNGALIVNGGANIYRDSKIGGILIISNTSNTTDLSSGSLLIEKGGASIAKNLNIGGIITIYNTSISNNVFNGSLITLGGISIQNTSDATDISSGGALTIDGGVSIQQTLFAKTINIINANISSNTLTNSILTNSSISNLNVLNANIIATNISNENVLNASISNLNVSNGNLSNLNVTNGNLYNINVTNANVLNSNILNSTISNANILSLNANDGYIALLTIGNLYVTNNFEYNDIVTNLSSANIINNYSSIGSLQLNNGTFGSIYTTNFININSSIQNLNISNVLTAQNTFVTNNTTINFKNLFSTIGNLYINGTISSLNSSTGSIVSLGGISINNGFNASSFTEGGSLTINGGIAISDTAYIKGLFNTNSTIENLYITNSFISDSVSSVDILNTTDAINISSGGGITIFGGASIAKTLIVGGTINSTSISTNSIYSNFAYITNTIFNLSSISNLVNDFSSISNLVNINSSISNLVNINSSISNLTNTNLININLLNTNLTNTNLLNTNLINTNLINTNLTNTNIINTNLTNTNLINTNLTNINLTTSNAIIDQSTINNTIITNITYSTLIGNYISANIISNNIFTSSLSTIANLINTNSTINSLQLTNGTFNNIFGSFFYVATGTVSTLINSNFTSINSSISNLISNNASITNLISTNASITNIISTNSSTTNLLTINSTIPNLVNDNSSISNLISINSTIENLTNVNSSTSNLISVYISTSNLFLTGIIPSLNSTSGTIILNNGGISINCTVNSTSITSGGSFTVRGGAAFGNNVYIAGTTNIYSELNMNNNLITNVTSPSYNLDVANKYYVDSRTAGNVFGSFTQGQVIIAGTIGSILSYSNLTFDGNLLSLNSTIDATSLTNGGTLQVFGGASFDKQVFIGNNAYILGVLDMNNQKITSVGIPTTPYDGVNKYYSDSHFNISSGQIVVSNSDITVNSFNTFTFNGTLLTLGSTENAIGLGSGGTLNVNGGVSILGNVFIGNGLDLNGKNITNVTSPNALLDVTNKYYVDTRFDNFTTSNIFGNFSTSQILVGQNTSGSITGYNTLVFNGTLLTLGSTENAIGLGSGGTLNVNGGVSILGNVFIGNNIDLNGKNITNVTSPNGLLDVTNKYYVDTRFDNFTTSNIFGNFSIGQLLIGQNTSGSITGYNTLVFNGTLLTLGSTENAIGLGSGGTLNVNGGVSILENVFIGNGLDLNGKVITNVDNPLNPLDAVNKKYVDYFLGISKGDIRENLFIFSNNIIIPTDISGFAFDNTIVSSFNAIIYLEIPSIGIYDQFEIKGLLKNNIWIITSNFIGDHPSKVTFSIINTGTFGQMQYTNKNLTGIATIRFRAITTSFGLYTNITTSNILNNVPGGGTGTNYFTQGTLLIGNGINSINTNINLRYLNNVLVLGNSANSTNLTSGGAMQILGGINIEKNLFVGTGINVNGQLITNVTSPSSLLDVANKYYVDLQFASSGSLNISSIIINGTINSINTSTGSLIIKGGVGIQKDVFIGGQIGINGQVNIDGPVNINNQANINGQLFINNINLTPSTGDIFNEHSFSAGNNINSPTNVTGFLFNNTIVRYFQAIVSIHIITTTSTINSGCEIKGIQLEGPTWNINSSFIGNNSNIKFTLNTSGQVLYTSSNTPNWISTIIKFRALTISI